MIIVITIVIVDGSKTIISVRRFAIIAVKKISTAKKLKIYIFCKTTFFFVTAYFRKENKQLLTYKIFKITNFFNIVSLLHYNVTVHCEIIGNDRCLRATAVVFNHEVTQDTILAQKF